MNLGRPGPFPPAQSGGFPQCAVPAPCVISGLVTTSPLSTDEIRAAAETHRELPPEYRGAVVDSFLEKVSAEIDARVDARVAALYRMGPPPKPRRQGPSSFLAVASLIFGIPLTAIVAGVGPHPIGLAGVVVIWAAIAVINIAWAGRGRFPGERRYPDDRAWPGDRR
jgi:hypothetical protein